MPRRSRIPSITRIGPIASRTGVLALLFPAAAACSKIPPGRSAVDDVTVLGSKAVSSSDVEGQIATAPSPKFVSLFPGFIYDYEIFDRATLQRDLARVERYYHARGYYSAQARAGRVLSNGPGHVRVEIFVDEGPPTVNRDLTIEGTEGLPPATVTALRSAARLALPAGQPFQEDAGDTCEKDAKKALTDAGYAYATVKRDTFVDVVHHVANTTLEVTPGETARFGPVTIEGLDKVRSTSEPLPEDRIRRALDLKEGAPYSSLRVDEATQALLDLEVFASVKVRPDLSHPETRVVPIHVVVEPTRLHELTFGGGLEFDDIKSEVHALAGWENHNFLGGLRDFNVQFQPGLVFYPTRISDLTGPKYFFPEEKLHAEFKQPGFLESRTEGFIRPEINVFPLLLQSGKPLPNDPVVGYIEGRGAVGVDRTFWKKLYVSVSLDTQIERPFAYKEALDPALSTLIVVYPELVTRLDFRDNRDHPHKGVYLANDLQWATGFLGSEAHDVKIQPEVRTYVPVAKKVTFATRASIGLLFPQNYGSVVENQLNDPSVPAGAQVKDIQTVLFRGLFSGGPTTNRGFPVRGVAPHGVVPFLNPQGGASQVASGCSVNDPTNFKPSGNFINQCSVPIGGFTLWELSNEVRFDIKGPLSAATFCDMGDVSPHPVTQAQAFRFDHLHLSCGVGARYDTPVGPIRLDIGYRIQPLQVLGYSNEYAAYVADPTNGLQPRLLGLPVAIAIGIGEAY